MSAKEDVFVCFEIKTEVPYLARSDEATVPSAIYFKTFKTTFIYFLICNSKGAYKRA